MFKTQSSKLITIQNHSWLCKQMFRVWSTVWTDFNPVNFKWWQQL